MSRNKFNLKDKKTKIVIGGTIIIVLLLFIGIGLGLSSMNNTDSKNIATQGQDNTNKKEENKKEDTKKEDIKKEETSSKEETKKEDTKTEGTDTSSTENKTESNEETSNTSNESTSSGSSSSGSSSSSSGSGSTNSKPSSGGSSSSNNNKPSSGGSSNSGGTSKPESHTHNWVAITEQVHHDEEGHWEDYIVSQAWTEEVPIYEEQAREICNGCGADITSDPYTHNENHMLNGEAGGWTTKWIKVQVGTNKIEHPAVTDKKWIVDKAAWSETVTTGYKCSCGATK